VSDYAKAVGAKVVTHKGDILAPIEARQFAADLIASATVIDGIDCANAWHNSASNRAAVKCPECRPAGAEPVAYVKRLEIQSRGTVTSKSGKTHAAERMTDETIVVYTSRGLRDATAVEFSSYVPD
jgi:hypothetical protein